MNEAHSVSKLLLEMQDGHQQAAQEIWDRFIDKLIRAADKKLKNMPRRHVDEEDVAQSAFNSFFRGAKEKRFQKLENREDLWQILAMITERKAIKVMRRELADKRGGGHVRGESVFEHMLSDSAANPGIGNIGDSDLHLAEEFTQNVRELIESLEASLRPVAIQRLEGFSNPEIAANLAISLRSVERKVGLIKDKWKTVLDQDEQLALTQR